LHIAALRKYYFDDLYEDWITRRGFYKILAGGTDWIDRNIVDRAGVCVGFVGRNLGQVIGTLETGQVQAYGAGMSIGILIILVVFSIWN
jgi:NADH:ubiquinone oxidoreductase subunit 5 (subunit L)/multisubunit Na+/H+ antiporter MnhA subunit